MRQEIIDFIHGFSESVVCGLNKAERHKIEEDIEKSKLKIFFIAISIATIGAGIFVTMWGIAYYIDQRFDMQGLGYVLVGMIAILTGTVLYKK